MPQWSAVIYNEWGAITGQGKGKLRKSYKGIHIGTWRAKSLIYERLRWHGASEKPSEGFIHFGKVYSDEFIRQTVSEKAIMKIMNGREVETYKNPEQNRNEALDLLVGNLAAFRRYQSRWDFDAIERRMREQVQIDKGEKKPEPKRSRMRRVEGLI